APLHRARHGRGLRGGRSHHGAPPGARDRGGDARRRPRRPGSAARLPGRGAVSGAILEVDGVEAYYGLSHVLFGVSLAAAPGDVVALLGRNGAGKSTTLRSI